MNPKKDTVAVTFRCDVSVVNQLDELCKFMGVKRSEFLITAITSEYDRIQGNPKLKEIMEQIRVMSNKVKEMSDSFFGTNSEFIKDDDVKK